MSQYLVLVDKPQFDQHALSEFDGLNNDGSTFHLISPVRELSADEADYVQLESDPAVAEPPETTAARWRLGQAMDTLRERGLEVSGVVGPESPLDAIDEALDSGDYDQVVVVTDAAGIAGWVGLDLASRIDRRVTEPVVAVEVGRSGTIG